MTIPVDSIERFWSLVDVTPGCWLWTGSTTNGGYGRFSVGLAHRFSYELLIGPIPAGLHIDHLCRTRACVNPSHLEPVTQGENNRRARGIVTHCPQGHEFNEENTYRTPRLGHRLCRACHRERELARYYSGKKVNPPRRKRLAS